LVRPLRSQTDPRSVDEHKAAAFGLYLQKFKPFPALDEVDADAPAIVDVQLADAAIAVTAILPGEPHDIGG